MKKTLFSLFSGLAVVATLFMTACGTDSTTKKCTTDCGVHGTPAAADCKCACAAGYKLDAINGRCDVQILGFEAFGNYTTTESLLTKPGSTTSEKASNYDSALSELTTDATGTKVRIKNLGLYTCQIGSVNQDYFVEATMKGDSILVPSVVSCATTFVGKGILVRDVAKKLTGFKITYSATYKNPDPKVTGNVTDKYTDTFVKK